MGLLTSGHLLCENRARSNSESLISTASKPGLSKNARETNAAPDCHIRDLTSRNYAETSEMDLSQPLELDIYIRPPE